MTTLRVVERPQPGAAAARPDPYLDIAGLSKRFGPLTVLDSYDLAIGQGEFVTLLGPSGCGKTTLLRLIAGLLHADEGHIHLGGRDLVGLPAHKRNIGMVFQSYALFPHLTVAENVAFGLKAKRRPRAEIASAVREALELVRLADYADRSVRVLSGGQQQRVSVARAMVVKPSLMLFDEPFSALDRKLRETMQIETRQLLRRMGATAIFVTHDQEEALVMSDRIAVMNEGRAEQIGDPGAVYAQPATPFVLDFVGQALKLHGKVIEQLRGQMRIQTALGPQRARGSLLAGASVLLAVRPENAQIGRSEDERFDGGEAIVREIVFRGSKTHVLFDSQAEDRLLVELPGPPPAGLAAGQPATLRWPVAATLVYPLDKP